jgi:hypothetical protein
MKLLYKYSLLILSVLFFSACEKETEGLSRVTYYCDLELKGNPVELVVLGQAYNEPGWEAYENDEDVSDAVVVTGTVNTGVAGLYRLTYSVNNTDGFPKTATRQIVVYDATPSPMESGFYTVSANSNRNGVTFYGRDFTILIYQVRPGVFYVSDLFGGYYDQRAAYGSAYAMVGHITLAGDLTITLNDSHVDGWGDSLDGMSNGAYDPATKTASWTAGYAGLYDFNVIAAKQ